MIPYVYEDLCEGASMGWPGAGNEMTALRGQANVKAASWQ